MIRLYVLWLAMGVLLSGLLSGCIENDHHGPESTPTQVTEFLLPTQATIDVPIPLTTTPNLLLTPPPLTPRLSRQAREELFSLLSNEKCIPPCYLNMRPGETTFTAASSILARIEANLKYSYERVFEGNAYHVYSYSAWLGLMDQDIPKPVTDRTYAVGDNEIVHSIDITVKDEVVQRIIVNLQTSRYKKEFSQYWSIFGIKELVTKLGSPTDVFVTPIPEWANANYPRSIVLVFENLGVVVETGVVMEDGLFCPIQPDSSSIIRYQITLTDPNSGLGIFAPEVVPPTNREVYLPIEEALGIDLEDFYLQVLDDLRGCFHFEASE